jgi:hypothetical protein
VIRISKTTRRAFLGGAGAVLALPVLDSLRDGRARAADPAVRRLLCYYIPCGIHMAKWTPASEGAGYALTEILEPLVNVKEKLLVLSGLDNAPAKPDGTGDHASGTGAFLTNAHPKKTQGADIQNGISMDQVAAATLGPSTRIASMQLGIDGGSAIGDCDSGYSCAYARNISWASETQPLQKTTNPGVVFDQIFEGFDPQASAAEKTKRLLYRSSVLDYVMADAKTLSARLGTTDQQKLDQYMTGVYEVEEKIKKSQTGPACDIIDKPPSDLGYPEHVLVMSDLMVLALQCDATRVITFMLGNAGSNRSYDFIGVSGGHHEISHHQDQQANFDKLTQIDIWEMQQFAYLLEKMDAIDEGEGVTLLDNSAVYLSSEIEDGNSHSHFNMPVLLAGTAGGTLKSGRHVSYQDSSVGQLYVSMLNAVGVEATAFGDAQGALPNLT